MLPDYQNELDLEIENLERQGLQIVEPGLVDLISKLDGLEFKHVKGIAKFWEDREPFEFFQHIVDLVTAAHSYQSYFTYVLTGNPNSINLYYSLAEAPIVESLLRSALPQITLDGNSERKLGTKLKARFNNIGMISGIPSLKSKGSTIQDPIASEVFEFGRLVRGMRDASWVYVVQAFPRSVEDVWSNRNSHLEKIARIASISKYQQQQSAQASQSPTDYSSETISKVQSWEVVNRRAEYTVELLEREVKRLNTANGVGGWQVAVFFGATDRSSAKRLAALIKSLLSGPESIPDPIRIHYCSSSGKRGNQNFHTYLTSEEVGLLIQPLRSEVPGYALHDLAQFDTDFYPQPGSQIEIGQILWEGRNARRSYRLKLTDLAKHGAVFGVTGSGKTTTILRLLHQCWQGTSHTPFLVIEPAKTEYRSLLGEIRNNSAKGLIPDLRIYTLGNDTVAPFRFNPFEFELSENYGGSQVLSHIDYLKAVFNASFILYAPMPYILEAALHEVYEDKGWNLANGVNVRLSEEDWPDRYRYPIFPTLTDLFHKVKSITSRFGYEVRIEQDVIAGLQARIGSLRLGAKGLMLDTPRGMSMKELLSLPTVLELERIGNDDEKTFLMGLLLARLYEFRQQQATEGKIHKDLQHILVIEEAHRLLKNVNTQVDTESSNPRAQAVEAFANILAEVRHYGQGIFIAEQIPSKLTPDAIKNTNLKVIHRLVAEDDRSLTGSAMNMNEEQVRHLAKLEAGEAVVFSEGDDHPYLVKVDNLRDRTHLKMPLDRDIPPISRKYINLDQYLPVTDLDTYGVRKLDFGIPESVIYQSAIRYLNQSASSRLWARIITRTIFARNALPEALLQLRQFLSASPGQLKVSQYNETMVVFIVLGANQAMQERGAELGWSYTQTNSLGEELAGGLLKLVRTGDLKICASQLDRFVRSYEKNLRLSWGPYPGCQYCRSVCTFFQESSRVLSRVEQDSVRSVMSNPAIGSHLERIRLVAKNLNGIVKRWLGEDSPEINDIAYCTGLIVAQRIGLDEYEQADFSLSMSKNYSLLAH